jgi:predicted anti-sigma-YlaC factor YlaD
MSVLLRRRDVVCREAVELVTDYLEGALTRRRRARFERHLTQCPHCREYFEQMRATIAVLGRVEPESLAPEVRAELVALYRRWRA